MEEFQNFQDWTAKGLLTFTLVLMDTEWNKAVLDFFIISIDQVSYMQYLCYVFYYWERKNIVSGR